MLNKQKRKISHRNLISLGSCKTYDPRSPVPAKPNTGARSSMTYLWRIRRKFIILHTPIKQNYEPKLQCNIV